MEQFDHNFKFTDNELEILRFWQENNIYNKIVEKNKNGEDFRFIDGPPFPSSDTLHMGHVHISMMKSTILNYKNMHQFNVLNKIGYDTHGLPIEMIVNKLLNFKTNQEIVNFGIGNYNNKCEEIINQFAGSWEPIFNRIGRFLNFNNQYKTMDLDYMESVWWVFKQLWNKGLIYRSYRIMPYSTECGTSLSISEASGDDVYKNISTTSIYVKFKSKESDVYYLVWTTTPWTLPTNLALAVNPEIEYVKIQDHKTEEHYILSKNALLKLYPKNTGFQILEQFMGTCLENIEYLPIFDYYNQRTFKIILAGFVEDGTGTGIVHQSPAFGQEDFNLCIEKNVVNITEIGQYCPIDENGRFTEKIKEYHRMHVFEASKMIIEDLKKKNILFKKENIVHKYPHCWRTDTPLIYKAVSSFFVNVTSLRGQLLETNKKINWVPKHIGANKFENWLKNSKDWGISRSRFFGTPIPVWVSDDGEEMVCVGSIDELVELANLKERPTNIHLQYMKEITIPSKKGKGDLKLVMDIFDCWFESGCAPYGQIHYPFENQDYFNDQEYLCDFILESDEQFKGWFYTLHVLSTALFNKPAYKNVVCSGLILAEDGKKFSKRLGNFTHPITICNDFGADSLRMYLIGSPAAHAETFKFDSSAEVSGKYFQWFNSVKFLIEHLIKFEKDGHQLDIKKYMEENNVMDSWILSKVRSIIHNISDAMNNYTVYKVKPEIMDFIENLTNWYLKFNRNRFRGRFTTLDDQNKALNTLYHVLLTFSIIMAPFAPFLAETLYQKLKKYIPLIEQKESVHLNNYPKMDDFRYSPEIERRMNNLQKVAYMVRNLRTKSSNSKSNKMPLKKVIIVSENNIVLEDLQILERYMREEINTIDIEYKTSFGSVNYVLEPNHKELGQKFKKNATEIKKMLKALSQEEIKKYIINKESFSINLNNQTFLLDETMVKISKTYDLDLADNQVYAVDSDVMVIVDMTQDINVVQLHIMRLLIVNIQQMRKETSLRPWDKINIYYQTESETIKNVINKYYQTICQELTYNVIEQNGHIDEEIIISKSVQIHDANIMITITKKLN